MKDLIIVIVPQEYKEANHKYLWHSLAEKQNVEVLILDIPVDYLVTIFKKKIYRIRDNKKGLISLGENISKYRPIFAIRPEIIPHSFGFMIGKSLKRQIMKYYNLQDYNVSFIVYDPKWVRFVKGISPEIKVYYYILDELKYHAHNDNKVKKNIVSDEYACTHCNHIFTMSEAIKENRSKYRDKITVLGNGSLYTPNRENAIKIKNSVGFIGNFRNWIDEDILTQLIEDRQDLLFGFVGPIEANMKDYMNNLLNSYNNTSYFGVASKEKVNNYYKMFEVIIIPYKQNNFTFATRPIKIVESIFAGTPIVSIPMSGYNENSFIKIATNTKEFSNQIDSLLGKSIDTDCSEYKEFVKENSWQAKSKIIYQIISTNSDEV